MYKRCVNFVGIQYRSTSAYEHNCIINYNVGESDLAYDILNLDINIIKTFDAKTLSYPNMINKEDSFLYLCDEELKIKLSLFEKYKDKLSDSMKAQCISDKEPYTCHDNELRKLYYFYNNPKLYTFYSGEEDEDNKIVKYLLQREYKAYISKQFLLFKYYFYFIFLFIF